MLLFATHDHANATRRYSISLKSQKFVEPSQLHSRWLKEIQKTREEISQVARQSDLEKWTVTSCIFFFLSLFFFFCFFYVLSSVKEKCFMCPSFTCSHTSPSHPRSCSLNNPLQSNWESLHFTIYSWWRARALAGFYIILHPMYALCCTRIYTDRIRSKSLLLVASEEFAI